MSDKILNGAFTSELTFECDGLYPITIKLSILGSLMVNNFNRAENVVFLV
jgi:hypothetical protein